MRPEEFRLKWMIRGKSIELPNYKKPNTLFKYLNQEYIDDFFKTGRLKLGTFEEYKQIEDSSRKDKQEGTHEYFVWNKDRSHSITLRRFTGQHNFIFCTSMREDLEVLGERFNTNGYFKITNTFGFAYELSSAIKGFSLGLEGPSIYTKNGQTNIFTENWKVPDFNSETPMPELFQTFDQISKFNLDLYFSKSEDPYSIEEEYRFLWLLDHLPSDQDFFVKCPRALRFCERVT